MVELLRQRVGISNAVFDPNPADVIPPNVKPRVSFLKRLDRKLAGHVAWVVAWNGSLVGVHIDGLNRTV